MRLTLVLTHACNLACTYCYMGEHHATAMTEELAGRAVDLLFEATDRPALAFFGGEPLLAWERLVFAVERAERRAAERGAHPEELELQLTTNATLLTVGYYDPIIPSGSLPPATVPSGDERSLGHLREALEIEPEAALDPAREPAASLAATLPPRFKIDGRPAPAPATGPSASERGHGGNHFD